MTSRELTSLMFGILGATIFWLMVLAVNVSGIDGQSYLLGYAEGKAGMETRLGKAGRHEQ